MDKIDYVDFAGIKVKITTTTNEQYEGIVWGFMFEDEFEEKVVEVWMDDYTFPVEEIESIETTGINFFEEESF